MIVVLAALIMVLPLVWQLGRASALRSPLRPMDWAYTLQYKVTLRREPWRSSHLARNVFTVPLAFLSAITDRTTVREIRAYEADHIKNLHSSIAAEGLREPLEIILDDRGRVGLRNGHHRVPVLEDLGHDPVPVYIGGPSQRIRKFAAPLREVLPLLRP